MSTNRLISLLSRESNSELERERYLPVNRSRKGHSYAWYVETAVSLHWTEQNATPEHFGHQTGASFTQSSSLKAFKYI